MLTVLWENVELRLMRNDTLVELMKLRVLWVEMRPTRCQSAQLESSFCLKRYWYYDFSAMLTENDPFLQFPWLDSPGVEVLKIQVQNSKDSSSNMISFNQDQ